jgi:hypothetical protein
MMLDTESCCVASNRAACMFSVIKRLARAPSQPRSDLEDDSLSRVLPCVSPYASRPRKSRRCW